MKLETVGDDYAIELRWCCGAVEHSNQMGLAVSVTVYLLQKKYGALSTYPIGKERWRPMKVWGSDGWEVMKIERQGMSSGRT